jgi:shikimate dehydrogenase
MGYRGFNCSMPHKVNVIKHLDGLGESAEIMGAVNCVVRRQDKMIGENTDGKGFLRSLSVITDTKGTSIVIFGAGGAARAIAVELALAGVKQITVVNRSETRGSALASLLSSRVGVQSEWLPWPDSFKIPNDTDIVVNATSIGLYDSETSLAIDTSSLKPNMTVADVIFSPPQTRWIRDAMAAGCSVLDGLGMLVNQGVIGVQYWTGIEPDSAVMRKALMKALGLDH